VTDSPAADTWLWVALVVPSSFIVHKYLGPESTLAYAIVAAAIVARRPRLPERLSKRLVPWLALLTLVAVLAAFVMIYPAANTHVPGAGSDDDDAMNVGTIAMLAGRSPYSATTYLGNAVHHLPGGLALAVPFVLLGTSAFQNFFWLPLFFFAVNTERDSRTALELAWTILLLSPGVMYEIVTGTGYVSNTIYVLLGLWWLVRTRRRDVAAAAWGVALASRANFIFLVPVAFGYLRQHAGVRPACRAAAVTCATIGALTLPLYLHDRRHFGPLEGANRLLVFDQLVPHLGIALMLAMAALAVAVSFRRMDRAALFRYAALVQAFPIAAGVVLTTVRDRGINLTYTRYGAFFAWFTFLALAIRGTISATPQCPRQLNDD